MDHHFNYPWRPHLAQSLTLGFGSVSYLLSRATTRLIRFLAVTGCSQGLGKALLETVLAAGERVVATLRNPLALAHLQSKYPTSQLLIWPLDVTSASQINDAFEATKKHFNRLDVVVNNAGYGLLAEIEATPDEEARKIIEVLYWGPVNITKKVCSSHWNRRVL
jgi:NAD(P)-dependent dehydrogenase (short-subunit alcohol dehydrogenase family)